MTDKNIDLITEALHIADAVKIISDDVSNELLYHIRRDPQLKRGVNKNLCKAGSFSHVYMGLGFNVQWEYYNFDSKEEYLKSEVRSNCFFSSQDKLIKIIVVAVKNKASIRNIEQSIEHEISHMFEFYKMGALGRLKRLPQYYNTAARKLMSKDKTIIEYYVAVILYNSLKTEQNAMANGAYKYLMQPNANFTQFRYTIEETDLYIYFKAVSEAVDRLSKHSGSESEITEAVKNYQGLTVQQLLKIGEATRQRMAWLIGRIIVKATDDYKKKYGIIECIKPETIEQSLILGEKTKKIIENCYKNTILWNN